MSSLLLQDGTVFHGELFGSTVPAEGNLVYAENISAYTHILTDRTVHGCIVVFNGMLGAYGVPSAEQNEWSFAKYFESESAQVRAVVCPVFAEIPSQHIAVSSLQSWLEHHKIPGIFGVDTQAICSLLQKKGSMLCKIVINDEAVYTPVSTAFQNTVVSKVTTPEVKTYVPLAESRGSILLYDLGLRNNLLRVLLENNYTVHRVPHNYDVQLSQLSFNAVIISDGPGSPQYLSSTIAQIKTLQNRNVPILGIGLGFTTLLMSMGASVVPNAKYYGYTSALYGTENEKSAQYSNNFFANEPFVVEESTLPTQLTVIGRKISTQSVAAIRHKQLPIEGYSFAIDDLQNTRQGVAILHNFLLNV